MQHLVDCEKLLKSDLKCSPFLHWQGLIFVWKQGCERLFISLFPPLLLQREAPPAGGSWVSWVECSPCGRSSFSSTSSSSHLHRSTSLIMLLLTSSPPFHHFPLLRRSLPPHPSSRRPSPSPTSSHLPIISPPLSSAGCLLSSSTPSTTSSPRRHNFLTTSCTSFLYLLSRSPAVCVYWRTSIFSPLHLLPHCHLPGFFSYRIAQSSAMKHNCVMTLLPLCNFMFHFSAGLFAVLMTFLHLMPDSPMDWESSQLGGLHVHVFAVSKLILLCTHTYTHTHRHTPNSIWKSILVSSTCDFEMWKRKLECSHMHSKAK